MSFTTGNIALTLIPEKLRIWAHMAQSWLVGGVHQNLPKSISETISKQQESSERLIGWIQIFILLVFTLLYFNAPTTRPENAAFEPVPYFLGTYFLFTCVRLFTAYRTNLKHWVLNLSILVDMGLLMGLIWSFHLQYMQPPSFYLKSPTLLYIFIFISLRALRLEPGYVLLSGLVGAAGWLIMVFMALIDETGMSWITRDYVKYLTSNSVLVGGEIDKVISILVVTIILTLAVARSRRLLTLSIINKASAQNLSHFVPESVAEKIKGAEGPLIDTQTETREASILFLDLVSFTTLAERLTPDELIKTLNEYFRLIAEPIERHHGVISQFQGDAILASFNLPSDDPDHATNAVEAALEIELILSKTELSGGFFLKARAGINTGKVVGGFVGTSSRLSYTVYGDDVNIAARLQELAKERDVSNLISARTRQLCKDDSFAFTSQGSALLRGRKSPVDVFEAKSAKK